MVVFDSNFNIPSTDKIYLLLCVYMYRTKAPDIMQWPTTRTPLDRMLSILRQLKLHYFDLLWTCCADCRIACCATNPQKIEASGVWARSISDEIFQFSDNILYGHRFFHRSAEKNSRRHITINSHIPLLSASLPTSTVKTERKKMNAPKWTL